MNRAPLYTLARVATASLILISGLAYSSSAYASPDETGGSGFLLPLPHDEDLLTPTRSGGGNDAVSVSSPESVDEAIALLRRTEEAQQIADSIASTLASAEVELKAAITLEALASRSLDSSQKPVKETQDRIGVLAARTYMSGGAPEWAALIHAESPQEVIEISTFAAYMNSVSSTYVADAERANAALRSAEDYLTKSIDNRLAAEKRVTDLEANLATAQLTISTSIAAYQAYISAPGPQTKIGPDGCPVEAPPNSLRGGSLEIGITELCQRSIAEAPSSQAALAIKTAFSRLGAPYACEGVGRLGAWRFDCSSLVSRSYADSSGIPVARIGWAPSTRDMIPWDGVALDPHYVRIEEKEIRPGDLLLYRSCTTPPCSYQHVVMALVDGYILHTNDCGDIAHITKGRGYGPGSNFIVARRVVHIEGEQLLTPTVSFPGDRVDPKSFLNKRQFEELQERQSKLDKQTDQDADE